MIRWRGWLMAEVVIAFLPLVGALALGAFMTPVWVGMLVSPIFDADMRSATGAAQIAITIGALLLVCIGVFGLVGLYRVVRSIVIPDAALEQPRRTRLYAIAATIAIALVVVIYFVTGYRTVALLGVPSLVASVHVMYLARHKLFPNDRASAA